MTDWYCIYTKQGQEDSVSAKLSGLPEIEVFNPKIKTRKCIRSKPQEVIEELFPCYIFAGFDEKQYFHTIKYTRGVRRFVGSPIGEPYTVDPFIIDTMKSRMKSGIVCIEPPKFANGEKVVIMDGPFSGLTGLFLKEMNANERVLVLLNSIYAKVELDIAILAKA